MNVIFVAPNFPDYQWHFVRALKQVGARVIAIDEAPYDWLKPEVQHNIDEYEQVPSVTNTGALYDAVKRVQARHWVDRLEATIEAHMLPVAEVREACTIPGLTVEQTTICRDKTKMKDFMREHGIACAASTKVDTAEDVQAFAKQHGYPLILKPVDAAGAASTYRVDDEASLTQILNEIGGSGLQEIAVEEFVEGHEGFYDTLVMSGEIRHEFISHYYPNVLEAMRTRWISPVIITTNRVDAASYNEVKAMGHKVIKALGLGTTPTHMEWFFGDKGLKFSEIGARPPGVGQWDLYCTANDIDIYGEWASGIVHGSSGGVLSRNYASAIISLRPSQDGHISGYEGVDAMQDKYGQWVTAAHFPPIGTPTQPISAGYKANAWVQIKYPNYDDLQGILEDIGQTIKVIAS
ncbi:MAG: ATP-grasp domain-containing protein [Deinococcota bacterium]